MLGFIKKRSVGIIMILTFLLSLVTPFISAPQSAFAVPTKYDCGISLANFQEKTFDTGTTAIPRYHPDYNLEINWGLFRLYGIAAYGDLTKIPGQHFKAAYEDKGQGTVEPGLGRFSHQGQCGEWRYYGYDVNGNLYYNFYFPADQWGGNQEENKRWI